MFRSKTLSKGLVILLLLTLPMSELQAQTTHLCSHNKSYNTSALRDLRLTAEQEKFDVTYYSVDFDFDMPTRSFDATVLTRLTVIENDLHTIELDYANHQFYDLINVSLDGEIITHTHSDNLISIALEDTLALDSEHEVLVEYSMLTLPENTGWPINFWNHNGEQLFWTLSSGPNANMWWPCKDHTTDKPDSMDIYITVPEAFTAVSNGLLRSVTENDDGTQTYYWHESYPIATYLFSINIYPYFFWEDEYVSASEVTMPISFYTYEDTSNTPGLAANYLITKDMISTFAELICEYPFINEKYGHAQAAGGTSMEHQTISLLAYDYEWLIAHELAHQWWGDMISPTTLNHMWLNEGFASYSEALWFEYTYGTEAYHSWVRGDIFRGAGTVFVEDLDTENIWDGNLRYRKGSYILHMLRHVVGDENFFEILAAYSEHPDFKYASATTEQFKGICEDITGIDLEAFFDQWIYGEYYPSYSYDWRTYADATGNEVELTVNQIQNNTGLFTMPLDVQISNELVEDVVVIQNSAATETYNIPLQLDPISLLIDPEDWVLKDLERVHEYTPYTDLVEISTPYILPGQDTLVLTAEANNPDGHTVQLSAMIESENQILAPHVDLFDDGSGFDEVASDGIHTGSWVAPEGEQFYDIDIKTTSIDSGYSVISDNLIHFTTAGPLVFEGFGGMTDTLIEPGGDFWFNILIRNLSSELDAPLVEATISCEDTSFIAQNMGFISFGEIAAGETVEMVSGSYRVVSHESHDGEIQVPITLDITSAGVLYWRDTFMLNLNVVGVDDRGVKPEKFSLSQNYPNPFNPSTTISYSLPEQSVVKLTVHDILGNEINVLEDENKFEGSHQVQWNGVDQGGNPISTGIYFARLQAGEYSETIKMVHMK